AFSECFDIVVAAFLLNYARSREELLAMCQGLSRSLAPGCRFASVNDNLEQPVAAFPLMRKYGLVKSVGGSIREGTPLTLTIFKDGGSFSFDNYYLSTRTYEWALASAGFGVVRWHQPRLAPQGESQFGRSYWDDFLTQPPIIFLECFKK